MCGHGIYDILTLMFDGLSAFGTVGAVIFLYMYCWIQRELNIK